jgi:glycosyltransferase involved in cell wall biosynthesis
MRIGIDMLAVQSPVGRGRGIGRYAADLVATLLARDSTHEYILYGHDGFPTNNIPRAPQAATFMLQPDPARGAPTIASVLDRLARTNPDRLDLLLTLSPFDMSSDYAPPPKPLNGLTMATIIYDFIPFLFQEQYMTNVTLADRYYQHIHLISLYDSFLAISEATRNDCLELMQVPEHAVTNISSASDSGFFIPDSTMPMAVSSELVLRRLGITQPFVFCLSGQDAGNDRKNSRGLIDAFSLLPESLRESHKLVITCSMTDEYIKQTRAHARERGVLDQLVLTNSVPDESLRVLYQRCAVFVFPSHYEGFGLPILEAMRCGAPVVAGNNSSQIEVVGQAGLLVNTHDTADIAAKTACLLKDRNQARERGKKSVDQAKSFTWERTADRAIEALSATVTRGRRYRPRGYHRHPRKPRIAVFSPLPPKKSGISDYIIPLIQNLKSSYTIDLFHELGYVPDLGMGSTDYGCFDSRMFDRLATIHDYRGILYQMGNSHYHKFVYQTLLRHPGIVTLHDFCLSGFHHWYSLEPGLEPGLLRNEIEHHCREQAPAVLSQLDAWAQEPGGLQEAFARRGLYLNRRIFDQAERVILHSPWCVERVDELFPEHLDRTSLIPLGANAAVISHRQRAEIRKRFDLPNDALICACFGILHPTKQNLETIDAFQSLASTHSSAMLLFVGQDLAFGEARRRVRELGLDSRVRIIGRQSLDDFNDLIAATDIGISLRQPPTNGETSAALLHLLRLGIATIVNNVGTFSGYPDHVVRKIQWEADGIAGLREALDELASDRSGREALGRAAREYVSEHHAWPRAAALYADEIERCFEQRARARAERCRTAAEPHPPSRTRTKTEEQAV